MYDPAASLRSARRHFDAPVAALPPVAATMVLDRVRKVLSGYLPGMSCDRRWCEILSAPMSAPELERERLFVLGWLNWLEGNAPVAEGLLAEADMRCRMPVSDDTVRVELPALAPGVLAARSAYWCARVRVMLGRAHAISEYESAMRRLGGSPQVTAWYVDLLWRAGRVDRAEQVWKSVRTNRRVLGCDEGPLLEARVLLRKGEMGTAEKLLREAAPMSGVVWVERQLLLCWAHAGLRQAGRAAEALRLAGEGPYPATALAGWRGLLEARGNRLFLKPEAQAMDAATPLFALRDCEPTSPGWRAFIRAQEVRSEGKREVAVALYRSAMSDHSVQPFARFGLACLGEEDPDAVLAATPGFFFALCCQARQAVERFRRREAGAGELLEVLRQANKAGYQGEAVGHFARLAAALQVSQPSAADLGALVTREAPGAAQRNAMKIALEQASHHLSASEALPLMHELAALAGADQELGEVIERQMLRLGLLRGDTAVLEKAAGEGELAADGPADPAGLLWQAARALHKASVDEAWHERIRVLRERRHYRGLAQALMLQEAGGRGDLASVAAQLEEMDVWRAFRDGPPRFVLRVLQALIAAHPTFIGWRKSLPEWIHLWDTSALGSEEPTLAVAAGLSPPDETVDAPAGVEPAAWFLHQAARALQGEDAVTALAFTQRALNTGGTLPSADVIESALPGLQRQADAQELACCLGEDESCPEALTDLVDLLGEVPGGAAVLEAAREGNAAAAWTGLDELGTQPGLPGRLHHHLALAAWRSALHWERGDDVDRAPVLWRMAWRNWLAFLTGPEAPAEAERARLLDLLLRVHARHINELLSSGDPKAARIHWTLVQSLATESEDLARRVAKFRDELATQYLLTTREAMRHGEVPEGWRADYERGLALLCRLLSLDRDNVRLLTALVEICGEWFIDLYHAPDAGRLPEQVKRFTPFALQLARLVADRPGELPARSALAEFWKFRGFVENDPASKVGLYREALRLDPSNANVRQLLAELGVSDSQSYDEDPEGSDDE
jgi:hypothetical protein